ncbi:MAG: hypothetical protein K9G46_06960 [Flavobacteriales bacterium]|nr:hypothetical protein [Flavobacteriales bacterium]
MNEQPPKTRYEILNDTYCHHLRQARKCQCPPIKKWNEAKAAEAMKEMHELAELLPFHPTVTRALGWAPMAIGVKLCQFCNQPMAMSATVCTKCLLVNP